MGSIGTDIRADRHALAAVFAVALMAVCCAMCIATVSDEGDGEVVTGRLVLEPNFPAGSGGTGYAKTYGLIAGNDIQLPTGTFSCDGYVLTGWGTETSGGTVRPAGGDYPMKTGTATLYAQWTKIGEGLSNKHIDESAPDTGSVNALYTHIMDLLGGMGSAGGLLYEHGVTASGLEMGPSTPAWLTARVDSGYGSGSITFSGSPDKPGNYIVHCYVKGKMDQSSVIWTINVPSKTDPVHTVTFDLNGGSGKVPTSLSGIYGQAFVLPGSKASATATEIAKPGFVLAGWDMPDEHGVTSTYALNSLFGMIRTATATAHWMPANNIVILSMDGGSLENVNAYAVAAGAPYSLPRDSKATGTGASKEGHTLIGWYELDDPEALYAPGLSILIDGTMRMQPHFAANDQMSSLKSVTFDLQGGTGSVQSQRVPAGNYVYLPKEGMEKKGATFIGWSLTSGGARINSPTVKIDSDTRLYALWETGSSPGQEWTVTFDTNGGDTGVQKQMVRDGGFAYWPSGVTKEGHILDGWYSNLLNRQWVFDKDPVTQDTVLRAEWDPHFTYEIKENSKGYKLIVSVTILSPYNSKATVNWGDGTSTETVTGKAEHEYAGPNASRSITVTSDIGDVYYTSSRQLIGLSGPHVPMVEDCIVTFDTAGGTPDTWNVTVKYGEKVERPEDPARTDYTFVDWYLFGKPYNFGSAVEYDIRLTAVWKDKDGNIIVPEPVPVVPKARASVTWNGEAREWKLDASGSVDAVKYLWAVVRDGAESPLGTDAVTVLKEEALKTIVEKPGKYTVKLTVTSVTGDKAYDTAQIELKSDDGLTLNWMMLLAIIAVAAAVVLIARYAL